MDREGTEIIEANLFPDHIHMLESIPPKMSASSLVGYLRGGISLMIFDRHVNMKYRYGNRKLCCKGMVGRNKKAIQKYIRDQLQEDIAGIKSV